MRIKVLSFLTSATLLAVYVPKLNADDSTSSNSAPLSNVIETSISTESPKGYKLGGSLLVETASTVNSSDPIDLSGSYLGVISYKKMNPEKPEEADYSASLSVGYMRSYSYEGGSVNTSAGGGLSEGRAGDFIDPRAKLSKTFKEVLHTDTATLAVKGGLGGLSRASEKSTWIGSLGLSASYTKGLGALSDRLKKFEFSQELSAGYGFYNYKTTDAGSVNKPFSASLNNGLGYDIGSGWSASTALTFIQQINFRNTVSYMTAVGVEVGYELHKKVSLGLGVSTASGLLAPNGTDYQFLLFRPDAAVGYLSATISI